MADFVWVGWWRLPESAVSAQFLQKRIKRDFLQKAVGIGEVAAVAAPEYFLRGFDDVGVFGISNKKGAISENLASK